ncbi:hypothetical protein LSM04_000314 [Trypanosoma melophagium]|nr:hypothetical protein LSM04_000314 [Trypanosoma melophagium]
MTNPSPAKPQTKTQTQPPQPQPVVGISRLAMQVKQAPVRHYEPIRTDLPLPNIALFGGLFGLTVQSATWALLGSASSHKPTNTTSLATNTASAVAAPSLKTATVVAGALTTAATTAPSTTTTTTTTNASPIPHPGVLSLELSGGVDDRVFGFLGSHAPDYSFFSDIDGVADD